MQTKRRTNSVFRAVSVVALLAGCRSNTSAPTEGTRQVALSAPAAATAAVFSAARESSLSWTPTRAGDSKQKATIALWFRVGTDTGEYQHLFSARSESALQAQQIWIYHGKIGVLSRATPDNGFWIDSVSATWGTPGTWHSLVAHFDLTKTTADKALDLWIDGSLAPTVVQSNNAHDQFHALFSAGNTHYVGITGTEEAFDGQIRDLHVLDGILLPADEFVRDGKPIGYAGSHGANGFWLDFSDAANIGKDRANGNNFASHEVTQVAL